MKVLRAVITAALLIGLILSSAGSVLAQEPPKDEENDAEEGPPIQPSVEFVLENEPKIVSGPKSNTIYIVSSKEVTPEVRSAIANLEVKAPEIFSPVFSEVTNLAVNPVLEDGKVVYHLELPVNTPLHSEKEVVQPIFDLTVV